MGRGTYERLLEERSGTLKKTSSILFLLLMIFASSYSDDDSHQLASEASQAYQVGKYEKCTDLYLKAIDLGNNSQPVIYNAACCAALSGDITESLNLLDRLAKSGYRDLTHITGDTDLEPARNSTYWNEIMARVEANLNVYLDSVNSDLYWMAEEDQQMRTDPEDLQNWDAIIEADRRHREKTLQIIATEGLSHPDDFFRAALIFQHGEGSNDFMMANSLAMQGRALAPGHSGLKWIYAASMDRWLWSKDKPQIYGTQSVLRDSLWTLQPIDTTAVTDKERSELGLPSLQYYRDRVKSMNGN